ncbi:Cation-independent mannose-6-phosphate receptor [Armadillidium nasatum]|uniref:Cation-independent mannose-6-phosphate receptor n=1 Tax=Armadillidium nasatum TaxID=96803 RepID=A0A5N5TLD9_9CRUS|nr:Cation-independent mannose-6-phosphate receptor [Armadillidium nasatum]
MNVKVVLTYKMEIYYYFTQFLLILLPLKTISAELWNQKRDIRSLEKREETRIRSDTSCIIKKDGYIYDLSRLSEKNYWLYNEIADLDLGNSLVFLLSICHPIKNVTSCGSKSGVCFATINHTLLGDSYDINYSVDDTVINHLDFTSGGQITKPYPEVTQEGSLKYVYENGGVCTKDNKSMKYKTELHLQCPLSSSKESGPILMSSPKCLFLFVWMTYAACPRVIQKTSDPCIITFMDSEYPLNLHSLHSKTFYKASGVNSFFEVNICGPVVNGSCTDPDNTAICDVSDPSNPTPIATSETISFGWQNDSLVLTYKSTTYSSLTNIHLHCDRTALTPKFFFQSKSENVYNFSVYAINICNPQSSDCVFEDKKLNVYDLRPLHKDEGNWGVIGRKSDNNVLFNLNVCGPINNEETDAMCPPGPVGACQASISPSGSRNLGYITSNPVANSVGTLTLIYTGGDSCKEGVPSSSTRITFICSDISYPPAFIEVTDTCEHLFEWHTPAACPVNMASSKDCEITDPLFGHNFDLNPLRNPSSDYYVSNGQQHFMINICGPLLKPCGQSSNNTAICSLQGGVSGGEVPAELVFNDGTLTMKFSNGAQGCGDDRWSSQILFLCSHDEKVTEGLQYIHADESSCVHHFLWYTKYVCPPHEVVECSVTDGDVFYDLSPLSDPNVNEIFMTSARDRKYVLNVCRSVIHSKESRCAYDAGACLIDISHKNKTLNLGKVSSGPYIEDGALKLKYVDGDKCNDTHFHSTVIEFDCTNEQYLSFPLLFAEDECLTLFKWSSVYACPQNISEAVETFKESKEANCTAVNSLTKYVFDLNGLKNETAYELKIRDGSLMLLSVCGAVNDSRCSALDSGVCFVSRDTSYSAGKWNQKLKFRNWNSYLEYEGGEKCSKGLKWSTRISFVCQDNERKLGPVLITIDEISCTYFVNWYAIEACERHIRCFAHSFERTYDLSPLTLHWKNYEVSDPSDENITYLINVCKPLNPVVGVNCPPGSSGCIIRKNRDPLGLGHPILNPNVGANESVHLMYTHGSDCPTHPGFHLSSRIIFVCNRSAGRGIPSYLRTTGDCQIHFEWQTSLVCPPPVEEGQCQIAFEAAKTNIDLIPLKSKGPYRVTYLDNVFLLNVCGGIVCDNSSAVCDSEGKSYGHTSQAKLRWENNALVLAFYGGDPCKEAFTGVRSTRIFFQCNPDSGLGFPEVDPIMHDLTCMAIFTWKTNLTCLESLYKSPETRPSVPERTQSTTTSNSTHYSPPEPQTIQDDTDMSEHTWISVLISVLVMASVVAASVYVVGRSSQGRRWYARAKRTFSRLL